VPTFAEKSVPLCALIRLPYKVIRRLRLYLEEIRLYSTGAFKKETLLSNSSDRSNKDLFIWLIGGITLLLAVLIVYLLVTS